MLLVGEASGVHRNLKKGLLHLGLDVVHYIQFKSQQGRTNDGYFSPDFPGVFGGVVRNVAPFIKTALLDDYDVVNFLNTITAVHGKYTKYFDLPLLRNKAKIMSYYAVGCDELGIIRRSFHDFEYTPCATCLASGELLGRDCESHLNKIYDKSTGRAQKYFDTAAISMVEYDHVSACFDPSFTARIPLPVDVDAIPFSPAKAKTRIKIAHTPTRRGFKGTEVVNQAIALLSQARNDFEFISIEGLNYGDYLLAMNDVDVVIDQVYSQSPGMNALEMAAAGKIVLTGATAKGKSYFDFMENFPGINAEPEPKLLCDTLSRIIDNKRDFPVLAEQSRLYIKTNHSCPDVAQKFLRLWGRDFN